MNYYGNRPTGLNLVGTNSTLEYGNPLTEKCIRQQWEPILGELGIEILGPGTLPQARLPKPRWKFHGTEWEIELITDYTKVRKAPYSVIHRYRQAQERMVPFGAMLWAEEHYPSLPLSANDATLSPWQNAPAWQPAPPAQPAIYASPTERNIIQALAERGQAYWDGLTYRLLDPALIGVIMTNHYQEEGLFCLLGMWPHSPETV